MQFDTIDDHFVPYAESYEDSTFILILHHIQINVNNVEITEHLIKLIICIYKYKYFISTNSSTING
jgi:hypothetical protein